MPPSPSMFVIFMSNCDHLPHPVGAEKHEEEEQEELQPSRVSPRPSTPPTQKAPGSSNQNQSPPRLTMVMPAGSLLQAAILATLACVCPPGGNKAGERPGEARRQANIFRWTAEQNVAASHLPTPPESFATVRAYAGYGKTTTARATIHHHMSRDRSLRFLYKVCSEAAQKMEKLEAELAARARPGGHQDLPCTCQGEGLPPQRCRAAHSLTRPQWMFWWSDSHWSRSYAAPDHGNGSNSGLNPDGHDGSQRENQRRNRKRKAELRRLGKYMRRTLNAFLHSVDAEFHTCRVQLRHLEWHQARDVQLGPAA